MKFVLSILIFFTLFLITNTSAAEIKKYSGVESSLKSRWEWALDQNHTGEHFWIGYSIERLMGKNCWIGACDPDKLSDFTLKKLLEMETYDPEKLRIQVDRRGFNFHSETDISIEKELKKVAILFLVNESKNIVKVKMSNLDLPVDLAGHSIYWINGAPNDQSISLISKLLAEEDKSEIREDLISAAGIHQSGKLVYDFMKTVIGNDDISDVREQAVFWMSQTNHEDALDYLFNLAQNDKSEDVREHAVFAVSQIETEESTDKLIELARTSELLQVRKKAIFWLGQKASRKSLNELENTVYDSEETELQEQAVFALSQLSDGDGVPVLIKVAKTHPNMKVRRKAIFWLGQTEDERALDAIISFVKQVD